MFMGENSIIKMYILKNKTKEKTTREQICICQMGEGLGIG